MLSAFRDFFYFSPSAKGISWRLSYLVVAPAHTAHNLFAWLLRPNVQRFLSNIIRVFILVSTLDAFFSVESPACGEPKIAKYFFYFLFYLISLIAFCRIKCTLPGHVHIAFHHNQNQYTIFMLKYRTFQTEQIQSFWTK